jgi:hypothetical protein
MRIWLSDMNWIDKIRRNKMEYEEVKKEESIPFDWLDKTPGGGNLGRMELSICLKFKRGIVSEFWVTPLQTHLKGKWHKIDGGITFSTISYEGLEEAWTWLHGWCKQHKAYFFRIYVPRESKYFSISRRGITFTREPLHSIYTIK